MNSLNQDASISAVDSGLMQISGELTFATVTILLEQSRPLLLSAKGGLVMELAGVGRVDSAGLALLIQWMRMAREQGVDILFRHVPEQLLAIAHASDLDTILPLEQG
ncbi:MAG: STAS domain-containing protein [Gammaproteobacteria bacterium]|nr:STAS domain-containing protein [Gammaproteobacteria bacterium]MCW8839422.1 STAS domain-containing protein [Gammaproteobacteria bacterium]MCW8927390.1 STAS domain-containing protein [Gammaproteobacteria bacterium]MCW8959164.1 STAS domain-containing protein [Gammaproteobacteria bacterium]MCW8971902.1 STAS domain-containing protein [Gammaproteobacteria bacterium]